MLKLLLFIVTFFEVRLLTHFGNDAIQTFRHFFVVSIESHSLCDRRDRVIQSKPVATCEEFKFIEVSLVSATHVSVNKSS